MITCTQYKKTLFWLIIWEVSRHVNQWVTHENVLTDPLVWNSIFMIQVNILFFMVTLFQNSLSILWYDKLYDIGECPSCLLIQTACSVQAIRAFPGVTGPVLGLRRSFAVKVCVLAWNTSYTDTCKHLMSQHVNIEQDLSYITLWSSLENGSSG